MYTICVFALPSLKETCHPIISKLVMEIIILASSVEQDMQCPWALHISFTHTKEGSSRNDKTYQGVPFSLKLKLEFASFLIFHSDLRLCIAGFDVPISNHHCLCTAQWYISSWNHETALHWFFVIYCKKLILARCDRADEMKRCYLQLGFKKLSSIAILL